jgi:hypothetical protein
MEKRAFPMNPVRVECYAGYRGDERPIRFALGAQTYEVTSLEDRWYAPDAVYFRVRADDGAWYILRHDEIEDRWTLEGYRNHRSAAD